MSSDAVHGLEGLRGRLEAVQGKAGRLQINRDLIGTELEAKRREVGRLAERQEALTKVLELYRVLMDKMVLGQVQAIESIVTEGLQTIFHDQGLSFTFEMGQYRGKVSAEPTLHRGDINGHPLTSFGGGPASIVGLLLRVLVLLRLKRHKMIFLDETLGAVSDEYIDATGLFLRKLADSSNLPILLVTHKPSFLEHATMGYRGTEEYEVTLPGSDGEHVEPRPNLVVHKLRSGE